MLPQGRSIQELLAQAASIPFADAEKNVEDHQIVQMQILKANPLRKKQENRSSAHITRLVEGIGDIGHLAFLLEKWDYRPSTTDINVYKARNVIIKTKEGNPLANLVPGADQLLPEEAPRSKANGTNVPTPSTMGPTVTSTLTPRTLMAESTGCSVTPPTRRNQLKTKTGKPRPLRYPGRSRSTPTKP